MIRPALILVLWAAPLLAQTARRATLGDRVRVNAPDAGYRRLTGQVIATTPDALQLRLDGGTEVAVMREHIDKMFLSLNTRRNTTRGAVIGAMIGGVAAFLYGPKQITANQQPGSGKVPTINIVTAAVGGAGAGALMGYYTRSDLWVALSPQP
jgi:hypothetical protein